MKLLINNLIFNYINMNEDILNEYEQEIPKDKLKFYIALFIAGLTIMILGFFLVLAYNKLANEQAKPKTIEEIAKVNIKEATQIKKQLESEIHRLELDIENKKVKLNQTNWCLENTNTGKVVDCYILSRKAK